MCGGEWRVFRNPLLLPIERVPLLSSPLRTRPGVLVTTFGLVTALEYCNLVTFPFPIVLR